MIESAFSTTANPPVVLIEKTTTMWFSCYWMAPMHWRIWSNQMIEAIECVLPCIMIFFWIRETISSVHEIYDVKSNLTKLQKTNILWILQMIMILLFQMIHKRICVVFWTRRSEKGSVSNFKDFPTTQNSKNSSGSVIVIQVLERTYTRVSSLRSAVVFSSSKITILVTKKYNLKLPKAFPPPRTTKPSSGKSFLFVIQDFQYSIL